MEVGYKVFRREIIQKIRLTSDRFGFEPEVTIKAARQKCRIYEVPISYHGRTYEEGKKITWKEGVAALYFLFKYSIFGYIFAQQSSQVLFCFLISSSFLLSVG